MPHDNRFLVLLSYREGNVPVRLSRLAFIIIIIIIINEKINVAFSPKTSRTRNKKKQRKQRRVR